jgi:hypothetical protein
MAVNPNTDFSDSTSLPAAQLNRFPRGIVAFAENATASGNTTIETVSVTSSSFTAVANRYYRISYYEPIVQYISGTVTANALRIRLTDLTGTLQQQTEFFTVNTFGRNATGFVTITTTLTAGSTVLVGTFAPIGGGTMACFRSATVKAQIIVEDLGPA